ncbi:MATE family efflux transporter [Lysinibacillus capsici]|mgnify:FL=1|uniref:MATE family efflux transporter n=1 Tax=Lysinibacillus capsici TaxID=2115968 RepID=UPI0028BD7120|nr:MATE family efflux transporter [Lysinibacillus capsici]MED3796242.1 MATE family efflux transporter [Lysinibacillus capsici]WNN76014.1 MATE family efflux transporter [Lysinibacillus capsici]
MTTINPIETKPLKPLFLSYLFPAMIGMLLMSVNILVDGIFVSHGVGPTALAGVNIAVPIFSILLSISLWIGMGGATLFSISLGEGNKQRAHQLFTLAFSTMLVVVITIIGFLALNLKDISYIFGASDDTYPYVQEYLHVILLFGIFYTIENLLSIFIRNDGNPKLAMLGLITTSALNILLNYVFIFVLDYGVTGCALATAIATIIGTSVLCLHFFRPQSELKFVTSFLNLSDLKKIFAIGLPSFIVEASVAVIVILYNVTFLHYLGANGVTAYAMVNYIHTVLLTIFLGVGMALQPLVSYHHGARLLERLTALLKIGLATAFILGLTTALIALLFPSQLMALFGDSSFEIRSMAAQGFVYFAIGYVFLGINMVFAEFFQSIEKIRIATTIMLLRSIILFIPTLIILPKILGSQAIWWTFPVAEGITALLIYLFIRKNPRTLSSPDHA